MLTCAGAHEQSDDLYRTAHGRIWEWLRQGKDTVEQVQQICDRIAVAGTIEMNGYSLHGKIESN